MPSASSGPISETVRFAPTPSQHYRWQKRSSTNVPNSKAPPQPMERVISLFRKRSMGGNVDGRERVSDEQYLK